MRKGRTPLEAVFLGTSGAYPSRERYLSSTMVETRDTVILVDAGEGAQYRLREAGYSGHEIDVILVTHLHGDHVFGLPGLLQGLSLTGRERPLHVLGPPGLIDYVSGVFRHTRFAPLYPLRIYEIGASGQARIGKRTLVSWTRSCHTIDSRAYRIAYIRPPKLDPSLLAEKGLKGPAVGALLSKGTYRGIRLEDVAVAPAVEYSLTITGDTAPCARIVELAYKTDILVHEATYDASLSWRAHEQGHSTALDAAHAAMAAEARLLVLTHISSRYRDDDKPPLQLLQDALRVHPDTLLAHDLMRVQVSPSWGRPLGYIGLEKLGIAEAQAAWTESAS